ncbi:hypothetical protein LAV72_04870 [Lysinibacillus xylanilyticus]|uniref:hypothetical protein n=1 Tax=Lysinibacillus xylanilyticus TaxID=582475 RepID=UPI002B256331|nr:hypothetical protein [Lysinibacillus xylanilyticus]MEB2298954.1 hypothetical protein [Lysinibacillus xylanilyticus]
MVGIIIALIFVFGFILFRNGIELNNVTIEFTILFVACSLIILLFWKARKGISKKIGIGICALLILQIGVISYYAYDKHSNRLIDEQNSLLVILGNSTDYQKLNLSYEDIEKINIVGDAKKGDFHHPFGYRIELKVKNEVYQFKCKGQGPSCEEMELINGT